MSDYGNCISLNTLMQKHKHARAHTHMDMHTDLKE